MSAPPPSTGVLRALARRAGFYALAGWVALTLNFLIPRLMPGDPAAALFARLQGQRRIEQSGGLAALTSAQAIIGSTCQGESRIRWRHTGRRNGEMYRWRCCRLQSGGLVRREL
jgi:hypothetical protein